MEALEQPAPRRTPRGLGDLLAAAARDPAAEMLLQLVDLSLAGVVFFAPLIMAGRHPWGSLVLAGMIATSAVCWAFYQARRRRASWHRTGVEWLLLLGTALLVVQLLPLPASWLYALSPHLPDALPLWTETDSAAPALGAWSQISLHPEATRGGLVMYLAYALLFLVVVQRVESREDAERLVRWVAIAAIGMALLGLFQLLTSNGQFLWLYAHPSRDTRGVVKGTFANQNHFAHFLALGLGPLMWWAHRLLTSGAGRRRRFTSGTASEAPEQIARMLMGGAFAAVGLAGLLTFSRAGLLAMMLAAATCGAVFWWHRLSRQRAAWGILAVFCLVAAALWIYGYDPLMSELQTLRGESGEELDPSQARRRLWQAGLRSAADYPLLGTGAGTHRDVYPTYISNYSALEYHQAENGYLRIFQETGLAGLLLLFAAIGHVVRWCSRLVRKPGELRTAALAGAISASVAASLFHALVDFVWYIPACLSVTVILAACGCRLSQLARRRPERAALTVPRSAWIAAVFVLLLISLGMLRNRVPGAVAAVDWDRYLTLAFAVEQSANPNPPPSPRANLDSPSRLVLSGVHEETISLMRRYLMRILEANPRDARAHLRMAQWSLQSFALRQRQAGNPLALHQIRDAALASQFESGAELDQWLERAVGPHRQLLRQALDHTRQALRLCPLQGEGYVYLAELEFLESHDAGAKFAYLDQAVRVRPHDHDVLLAAGREAAVEGTFDRSLQAARQAVEAAPGDYPLRRALAERLLEAER